MTTRLTIKLGTYVVPFGMSSISKYMVGIKLEKPYITLQCFTCCFCSDLSILPPQFLLDLRLVLSRVSALRELAPQSAARSRNLPMDEAQV
jgi:hypothetical protein